MATKKPKKPMMALSKGENTYDDKFADDLGSFLSKSVGINVASLDEHENIPYWIPTGCYSLNWIISNDFFKGLPGSKAILIAGECLGAVTEINLKVSPELYKELQTA